MGDLLFDFCLPFIYIGGVVGVFIILLEICDLFVNFADAHIPAFHRLISSFYDEDDEI